MAFIQFNGITKRFRGVLALDRVSFDVERSSCHALMGENGAGKTTLSESWREPMSPTKARFISTASAFAP